MSDIHQEWRELRKKNGDFICHLDAEMTKLEKDKKLLDEQNEQIFYDPMTCTYFKADPEEIQKKFESMRKDLTYKSECIDKMTADYSALIEENANLKKRLDTAQKEIDEFTVMYDKAHAEAHQAKVAKDRMGYSNRCMQSKIAKQANEIKRLIDDNIHQDEYIETLKKKLNELTKENAATKTAYKFLKQALGTSAKDADANFDRGYHKGMDELWDAIRKAQDECPGVLTDIYGQDCMHDCVSNLSAQDFAKKTIEWEEKQAKDIQIGDEVEVTDKIDLDLDDFGIVIAVYPERRSFEVIGPKFEGCFDETDIQNGNVRKTGRHFDSIPLDYFN